MRRTWMGVAGAVLLAGCGTEPGDANASLEHPMKASGGMGGMEGGGGGGGMGGGGGTGGGGGMGGGQLANLGKMIFFDPNLSEPPGQSCASCHAPEAGFTGPSSTVNATTAVYAGAASTPNAPRFGNRKPPSAAYATVSPNLHLTYDPVEQDWVFVGGIFWDGRATGWRLGSPAAEQALGPFVNPLEQNLSGAGEVVRRICTAMYGGMFRSTFGAAACSPATEDEIRSAYDKVGIAVAAFEASPMVNRFSSKYDRYLRGEATLTTLERAGLALFEGKAQCARCHGADVGADGQPPPFTDNGFENLGLPRNPRNPFYASPYNEDGAAWVDAGLGGFLAALASDPDPSFDYGSMFEENVGKHRVPTLRNVDKRPYSGFVKSYGHNGVFKALKEVVHFYNTRDALPRCDAVVNPAFGVNCWPAPEVASNVNSAHGFGDLGLTEREEDAVVAFLRTLSDG